MTSCFVRLVDWKPKEIPHWYGSSQTEVFPALTMSERAGTQCAEGLWLSSDALHAAPLPQQLIQHHSPRGRHVQRLLLSQHRNAHMRIRHRQQLRTQPIYFMSKHHEIGRAHV